MNEDLHREWSAEERRALEALRRDEAPDPALERRVLDELDRGGLLRRGGRGSSPSRRWLATAALFVAGVLSGALLFRSPPSLLPTPPTPLTSPTSPRTGAAEAPAEPRFILLLYEDQDYRRPPAGREAERNAEYGAWIGGLATEGRWVGGSELAPDGVLLTPAASGAGPPSSRRATLDSAAGELSGYFLFEAADLEAATEIASTCPHLRYGGTVLVRALRD